MKTLSIPLEGGLIQNLDSLVQAENQPGSLINSINIEPSIEGGYSRIKGYTKYNPNILPESGQVKGCFVFADKVFAMRGGGIYQANVSSAWTLLNSSDPRPDSTRYRGTRYNNAYDTLMLLDGSDYGYPVRIQNNAGTYIYTTVSAAPAGEKYLAYFHRYLLLAGQPADPQKVTFSAPGNEINFTPANGAGEVNVGFPIIGLGIWRDEVYVFGRNRISKLTPSGDTTGNVPFILSTVTQKIGCIAEDTIQEIGGDLVYLSPDGFRTIAGTTKLDDVEIGSISRSIIKLHRQFTPDSMVSLVINSKSQYRLFRATSTTKAEDAIGIVGTIRQHYDGSTGWEYGQLMGIAMSCADSGYVSGGTELIIHGGFNGYVYRHDDSSYFDTKDIFATFSLPHLVFGDPLVRKVIFKLCAFLKADGNINLFVGTRLDYAIRKVLQPTDVQLNFAGANASFYDSTPPALYDDPTTAIYDGTDSARICTNVRGSGMSISLTFTSNGGPSYNIRSVTLQYSMGGRR